MVLKGSGVAKVGKIAIFQTTRFDLQFFVGKLVVLKALDLFHFWIKLGATFKIKFFG